MNGDDNGFDDVFVRNLRTGTAVRASVDAQDGDLQDNSEGPTLSANGRLVTFFSRAKHLVESRQGDLGPGHLRPRPCRRGD